MKKNTQVKVSSFLLAKTQLFLLFRNGGICPLKHSERKTQQFYRLETVGYVIQNIQKWDMSSKTLRDYVLVNQVLCYYL